MHMTVHPHPSTEFRVSALWVKCSLILLLIFTGSSDITCNTPHMRSHNAMPHNNTDNRAQPFWSLNKSAVHPLSNSSWPFTVDKIHDCRYSNGPLMWKIHQRGWWFCPFLASSSALQLLGMYSCPTFITSWQTIEPKHEDLPIRFWFALWEEVCLL